MKSPILLPAVLMLAGILGCVLFPHARTIAGLLCGAGMLWLAYVYIAGQRRKA
jgi:hypothetical protein